VAEPVLRGAGGLDDRLTPLGTRLPSDGGTTWVGIPLTVHR
jgi:hypothetical protein